MTNPYYAVSGSPATLARGASTSIRNEFAAVQAGFALLPLPAAMYSGTINFLTDTGTTNAMIVALTGNMATYITSLTDGLELTVKAAAAVTGASTITITGVATNVPIIRPSGFALVANDIYAGQVVNLIYSTSQAAFQYSGQGAAIAGGGGLPTTGGTMTGAINFTTGALNEAKGANIASATTVNLTTATGNLVHITGATTITGFTIGVGFERTVIFDGSLTLTNGAALLLPGNVNIVTQAGDKAIIRGDTAGANVITFVRAATAAAQPPGYINGFTLANDVSTPNTVLDIAAGFAIDSTNVFAIQGTAFTKSTAGVWAAGTGANGMGTGLTIANSTWYHVFAIINAGAFDVYFDTSAAGANAPASTTAKRYIGSFKTDGSAHIIAFIQLGQMFFWTLPVNDISSGGSSTAALTAFTTPLGFITFPVLNLASAETGTGLTRIWSPLLGSSFSGSAPGIGNPTSTGTTGWPPISTNATNTSSQLYVQVTTPNLINIQTTAYLNPHVAAVF